MIEGGTLGLLIGASILSMVEVIESLITVIVLLFKNRKRVKRIDNNSAVSK
jgi:hypothetical protein